MNTGLPGLKALQHSYDEIYRTHGVKESDRFYRWVIDLLRACPGYRLLDVGCGSGYLLHEAVSVGIDAYGVDISQVGLAKALARNAMSKVVLCVGEHLPFADNAFERAACLGSLEHFLDPARGISEIARVLRPDGLAVVLVPNSFYLGNIWTVLTTGRSPSHGQVLERFGTVEEWRNLLEASGLVVRSVLPYNRFFLDRLRHSSRVWFTILRLLVHPFIPLNLSYSFVYICSKQIL